MTTIRFRYRDRENASYVDVSFTGLSQTINYLISQPKHMLWVLKRTSFEHPKHMLKLMGKKILNNLTLKNFFLSKPVCYDYGYAYP